MANETGTTEELNVDSIFEALSGKSNEDDNNKNDNNGENDEQDNGEEIIDLRGKDKEDDEEDEDEEEDIEDPDKDSGDEDEEDEELKLEDDEDELELAKIPTRAQIKAKYPNIFKEFKALDRIFYREKAYAEVFSTVKDATNAKEELKEYGQIQEELLSGDIVGVLSRVKQTNPKAYDKIAGNIIESLTKVDKDSYLEPARIIIKGTLNNLNTLASQALKKDASNKRAEQIQIAVELIHDALGFGSEVTPYNREFKEDEKENPEVEKLKRERQQIDSDRFREAHNKVVSRFGDLVTKTLQKNIDPKNVMTPYIKSNLIKDIKEELDKQLIADKRFEGVVKKLYERAKENSYNESSLNNILEALRNKTSSILRDIIRAKKGEALRGTSKVKSSKTRELSRENKGESATTRNSRPDDKKSLTRNKRNWESEKPRDDESVLDYLNRSLGD